MPFSVYNLVFSDKRRSLSEENLEVLVILYYNSFISYEYLVSLNFDVFASFDTLGFFYVRLVFLIIFLSDMHLSDFLCASYVIFRATGNEKKLSD